MSDPIRRIAAVALLVPDYDAGIAFYTGVLGFSLVEDTLLADGKRWVIVQPGSAAGAALLLARASDARQSRVIGDQAGGRVFLFLETDDFDRDHAMYMRRGLTFEEPPRREAYGTVAVFRDPFGNRWDLIQRRKADFSVNHAPQWVENS